jgi:hypothetical protein
VRPGSRANKQRIVVVIKWTNTGRHPAATGDLSLRLAAGDSVLEPMQEPSEIVPTGDTHVGDVTFEVPSATRDVTLRATVRDQSREVPLALR